MKIRTFLYVCVCACARVRVAKISRHYHSYVMLWFLVVSSALNLHVLDSCLTSGRCLTRLCACVRVCVCVCMGARSSVSLYLECQRVFIIEYRFLLLVYLSIVLLTLVRFYTRGNHEPGFICKSYRNVYRTIETVDILSF